MTCLQVKQCTSKGDSQIIVDCETLEGVWVRASVCVAMSGLV